MLAHKISVIMPVYNVQNYLVDCIESILTQSYKNFELIIVDDGSTDQSGIICQRMAKKDKRIKYIRKKNGGAASARNIGLNCMTGDMLCFIDSDDIVMPNYLETMYEKLINSKSDVAICNFEYLYSKGTKKNSIKYYERCISGVDCLRNFLTDWTSGLIWNKLFKIELLGNIRFPEGHIIDDEFFTYRLIMNAKQVIYISEVLYQYRMRKSSVMNSSTNDYSKLLNDRLEYQLDRFSDVTKRYPVLYDKYFSNLIENLMLLYNESDKEECMHKKIRIEMKKMICPLLKFYGIKPKKKILFIAMAYFNIHYSNGRNNPFKANFFL